MSKREQYQKILDKITIRFGIEFKSETEEENAIGVIEAIKSNSLTTKMLNIYPNLLYVKASKVENIIEAVLSSSIPLNVIEKHPKIIEQTNKARVSKIEKLLDSEGFSHELLYKNPDVLGVGKDKDIVKVIDIFKDNGIDKKYFYDAGNILAYGKPNEVKEIFKVLESKGLLKIILDKEPEVFFENTANVISDIIEIYEDKGLDFGLTVLKNHPEILSKTTAVRVQAIINMLNREGISTKVLKLEPKIVYINETKEISEIVSELKKAGVDKKDFLKIPEVLMYSNIETNKLITKLNFYNSAKEYFGDVVSNNIEIAYNSDIINVREYLEYVEKNKIDSNVFKVNPHIFDSNTVNNVLEILNNLEKINMKAYYLNNPNILLTKNPENIITVNSYLNDILKEDIDDKDEIEEKKYDIISNNKDIFFKEDKETVREYVHRAYKRNILTNKLSEDNELDIEPKTKQETNRTEVKDLEENPLDKDNTQKLEIGGSVVAMEDKKNTNAQNLEENAYINISSSEQDNTENTNTDENTSKSEVSKIDIDNLGSSEASDDKSNNTDLKETESETKERSEESKETEEEESEKNPSDEKETIKKVDLTDTKMVEKLKEFLELIGYDVDESKYLSTMFTLPVEDVKANYYLITEAGLLSAMKKGYKDNDSSLVSEINDEDKLKEYLEEFKKNSNVAEEIAPKYITILTKIPTKTLEKRLEYIKTKVGDKLINYNFETSVDSEIVQILDNLKLNDSSFDEKYSDYSSFESKVDKYFAQEMIESPFTKYLDEKIGSTDTLDSLDSSEKEVYDEIMAEIDSLGVKLNEDTYSKSGYAYSVLKIKENLLTLLLNISLTMDVEDLTDRDKIYIKVLSVLGNKMMDEEEAEKVCKALIINEKESESNPEKFIAAKNKENEVFRIENNIKKKLAEIAAEKEKQRIEAEAKRIAEEAKRKAEEEAKRQAEEEAKRKAEEEARRLAEEEKKRQEEEARRLAEEEKKRQEEEARRLAEEEKKRQEEEARRIAEEEKRQEEEARRIAEEEAKRKAEEERRKKLEEERKLAQMRRLEEIRRKEEEEAKRLEDSLNISSLGISDSEESTEGTKIEIDPDTLRVQSEDKSDNYDSNNKEEKSENKDSEGTGFGISIDPKIKMGMDSSKSYSNLDGLDEVSKIKQYELQDRELENMKNKLNNMSNSLKNFKNTFEERAFNAEYAKAKQEKERLSKIIQRRQEKELELLKKQNEELKKQKQIEEEKALAEKIRLEAEKLAQEKIAAMEREKEQAADQKVISVDDLIQSKETNNTNESFDEADDSIDKFYENNNQNNNQNYNQNNNHNQNQNQNYNNQEYNNQNHNNNQNNQNDNYNNNQGQNTNSNVMNNNNMNQRGTQNPMHNEDTKSQIMDEFKRNEMNQGNGYNNGFANSSNNINTPEFNRTIEAYYNPNQKAFFSIEDYGYILNEVDDEAQKKMQSEMNEIFKREKNNKYYD